MSLADCFKQAGKALDAKDRKAIESLVADGMGEAEAVIQHLGTVDNALLAIADRVEKAGGEVVRSYDKTYRQDDKSLDMSEAARMERAKEQGFDVEAYRGLYGDYDPAKAGNYQMFTSSPEDAGEYGNNVIRALLRRGKNVELDGAGRNFNSIPVARLPNDVATRLHPSVKEAGIARTDDIAYAAKEAGYDSVSIHNVFDKASNEIPIKPKADKVTKSDRDLLDELGIDWSDPLLSGDVPEMASPADIPKNYDPVTITIVFDPKNIRSVNAAFDPNESESSRLLAQEEETRILGEIELLTGQTTIRLKEAANASTFIHESGHLFLELEKLFSSQFGITEDQKTLLDWLGVDSFDAIDVPQHEQFARGFEQYLMEGKAPSNALREVFRSFKRWLVEVYKSISQVEPLNDDIRGVFDRMLASEAEIADVAANEQYDQFFTSAEAAGMTTEEWDEYQEKAKGRAKTAEDRLFSRLFKELTKRKSQEWADEKAVIVDSEIERLKGERPYLLIEMLKTDQLKLDREAVKKLLGVKKLNRKDHGMIWGATATKGGQDPELIAELQGFDSGEVMLNTILNTLPARQAAEEVAEQVLIAKYGDILNDGSIALFAREAMQSEDHAKTLLTEVKALQRKTKRRSLIDRKYLKAKARDTIATMKVKDLKPHRFYRNMTAAAQAYGAAKTDEERLEARTKQLANHYLYREALDAKEKMDRYSAYVKRNQTAPENTREINGEFAQRIKQMANLYFVGNPKKRLEQTRELVNWFEGQRGTAEKLFVEAEMMDLNLIRALESFQDPDQQTEPFVPPLFSDLTYEDARSVYDQLKHLRYMGRQIANIAKLEERIKRESLRESLLDNGGKDKLPPEQRGTTEGRDDTEKKWGLRRFVLASANLRNLVRTLDGFKENGAAFKLIYKVVEEGANAKLKLTRQIFDTFDTELGDLYKAGLADSALKPYKLADGSEIKLRAEDRFMMALYWGTESSRVAIKEGYNMTDEDVMAVMRDLTPEQLRLVNKVWKVNESLWPQLSQASIERYGVGPPKLEATPFIVNGVELTGGHMRLFYDDSRIEIKSAAQEASLTMSMMTGKAASLHARVGGGKRRPDLNLDNIVRSLDQNAHFIAFSPVSRTLASRVNSREIREAIERKHGRHFHSVLVETIDNVIVGRQEIDRHRLITQILRQLRMAATAKYLMFSLRNIVQSIGPLPVALAHVGPRRFSASALRLVSPGGSEVVDMIKEKSPFMRSRMATQNRDVREMLRPAMARGRLDKFWQETLKRGFLPQTMIDAVLSMPVWLATYEKALGQYRDEATAVSMADTAVNEAIGGGTDLHLGAIVQSNQNELTKSFTMFQSWFNSYFQRIYKSTKGGTDWVNQDAFMDVFVLPVLSAVLSAVVVLDLPEDEDEDGEIGAWEFMSWIAKTYGGFLAGTMPIARDIYSATVMDFAGSGVYSTAIDAIGRAADLPEKTGQVIEGEIPFSKVVADTAKIISTLVPLPGSGMAINILDYMAAAEAEDAKELAPALYQAPITGKD